MSLIILSSDCYDTGRDIARKVAQETGYRYIDREILGPIAEKHDISKEDLIRALDEPPGLVFGLSSKRRDKYLAWIQQGTLELLLEDNTVCHGLAAHLYVSEVSHAIQVRVLCNCRDRGDLSPSKPGETPLKTEKRLKRQEKDRKRLYLKVFDRDESDSSIYDMVLSLSRVDPDEAVRTIASSISYRKFQSMTYSINCLRNKELECRVRMRLLDRFPNATVLADGNTVNVKIRPNIRDKQKRIEDVKELASDVEGVDYVKVVYS